MKQKKYTYIFFLFCLCSFGLMSKSAAQTSVDELITNARQNKANKQFTSAFKYYYQADAILSKDKNNTDNLEKLLENNIEIGDLCTDWKVYDKAIQYYDKAQKLNANNNFPQKNQTEEILLENLAKSYEKLQKYPQATENYEKLLSSKKGTPTETEILKNLANTYNQQGFYDKGLARNLEILAIHQNQNNEKAQAIAYNNIGFSYKQLKDYPKSIENFKKASDIQNKLGLQNTPEHRIILTNLAILSQNQQDFKSAKKYLFEAENLLKNTSDKSELADIYNLIGTTYFYTNEQENAIKYSNLAINTGKDAKNKEAQKGAYNTLSQVHSVLGQYKTALEEHILYKNMSDSILQEKILLKEDVLRRRSLSEDTENELKLLGVEKEIRDLDLKNVTLEAEKKEQEYKIEKQEKANQIYELEQKQLKDEARTNSLLLEKQKNETILQTQALALSNQENQIKEAELKNAEITRQAKENETKKREEILLKDKKLQEQEIINEKQAKESQRNTFGLIGISILGLLFTMIWVYFQKRKDNIKLESQQIIILEKNKVLDEQKYQILEKNDELNATNEELTSTLDTVNVQRAELEEQKLEILVKNGELNATNEELITTLETINQQQVALQEQKLEILEKNDELNATNEELISTLDTVSVQREELEEKNHNITASINYAQRIQNAILPSKVNMNAFGVDNFVFFRPRDIVSGDFYWFHQIDENRAIFAAMDCTGHGVPGAFTSMIGYSTFNKVVIEEGTYSPEIILKKLDIYMSKALDNGDNKVMDGMDGSVILIDKQKKELHCAGAMNKIYYVQSGEFKEIEVSKHHIAGMIDIEEQKIFTLTTIPLTAETTVFMASDGYQDQFGGEKSKKFMTKNLKALLFENYQKTMDEQKNILNTTISEWITHRDEQTDDMLVMGLKIAL